MKKLIYIYFFVLFTLTIRADWVQVNNGLTQLNVNALTSFTTGGVNYIFAGTLVSINGSGVYVSTNDGATWSLSWNIPNEVWALASTNSAGVIYVYAATANGMGYTTNNGMNWQSVGLPHWIYSVAANGNDVYGGCKYFSNDPGGVYKSTNNGISWTQTSLPTNYQFLDYNGLAINGTSVYASAGNSPYGGNGTYLSTNYGLNWNQVSSTFSGFCFAINGNYIFGGGNGVWLSTNNGLNWTQTSLNNATIYSLSEFNNVIFAGGGPFWVSTDNGTAWVQRIEGLGGFSRSLCVSNGYIFTGTDGHGIYRRPVSELVGISPISEEVPIDYELKQNYPNPFNPSTKIKFAIPSNAKFESSTVKLIIFDILGRKIATLVNEKLRPGTYEVDWNSSGLSSGIYFYNMIADNKIIGTKKMIINK